jgi:hypothetical protein
MTSKGLTVNALQLELCEQTIVQQAAQFGGVADTFTQSPRTGSIFGSLPASARLAGLTARVNDAGNSQFSAAEKFLRGTEAALDSSLQGYLSADGVSAEQAAAAADMVRHLEEMG